MVAIAVPGTQHAKKIQAAKERVSDKQTNFDDPERASHKRRHRRDEKKLNKANAKLVVIQYLAVKKVLNVVTNTLKLVIGLIVCIYAGKLTVTGVYDLVLETHIPLKIYAGIVACLGALAAGLSLRAKARSAKKEPWLGVTAGLLIIYLGFQIFLFARTHPQVPTNTDLWHYQVPNSNVRHLLFRALPEGLLGGLLWVYWNWNHYRRCASAHWMERFLRPWWPTPGDPKSAMAYQVWLTPVFVLLVAAIPAFLMFRGILLVHDHSAPIHSWAHREIPWKADVAKVENNPAVTDKLAATITSGWPIWLIGFVCALIARPVSFGVIDDAQRIQTLVNISKSHGHLQGSFGHIRHALHFWQMNGYQARIIEEFGKGNNYRSTTNPDRTGPVGYAKDQLDKVDTYVLVPIRLVQSLMVPLIIVGAIYLYVLNG